MEGEKPAPPQQHTPKLFLYEQSFCMFFPSSACDLTKLDKTIAFYFTACPSHWAPPAQESSPPAQCAIMVFLGAGSFLKVFMMEDCSLVWWSQQCLRRLPSEGQSVCHPAVLPSPLPQRWLLALKLRLGDPGWKPRHQWPLQVTFCNYCVTWRCRAQHRLSCRGDQNLWLVACLCHLIKSTCYFSSLSPPYWCWTSWQRYREERDQSKVSEQLGQILRKNSAFLHLQTIVW